MKFIQRLNYPQVFTLMGWSETTTRLSPGRSRVQNSAPPYLAETFLANARSTSGWISARARISSVRYGLDVSRTKNVHSGCAWRFFTFWRELLSENLIVPSSSNTNQSAVTCG